MFTNGMVGRKWHPGIKWHRYALRAFACGGGSNKVMLAKRVGKEIVQGTGGEIYLDSLPEARRIAEGLVRGNQMGLVHPGGICRVIIGRHSEGKGPWGKGSHVWDKIEEINWAPIATAMNEAEMKEKESLRNHYISSKWEKWGNKFVLLAHGRNR